jgi:hypothetical protein
MTQRFRSRPDHPGNIVAQIIDGVGARASSLSDVDNLTVIHDGGNARPRFLFQELKHGDEPLDNSQAWILRDLTRLPGVEAWTVRLLGQHIEWTRHRDGGMRRLSHAEYRSLVESWWGTATASKSSSCPHGNGDPADCMWCYREGRVS